MLPPRPRGRGPDPGDPSFDDSKLVRDTGVPRRPAARRRGNAHRWWGRSPLRRDALHSLEREPRRARDGDGGRASPAGPASVRSGAWGSGWVSGSVASRLEIRLRGEGMRNGALDVSSTIATWATWAEGEVRERGHGWRGLWFEPCSIQTLESGPLEATTLAMAIVKSHIAIGCFSHRIAEDTFGINSRCQCTNNFSSKEKAKKTVILP